eukprot:g3357.t1
MRPRLPEAEWRLVSLENATAAELAEAEVLCPNATAFAGLLQKMQSGKLLQWMAAGVDLINMSAVPSRFAICDVHQGVSCADEDGVHPCDLNPHATFVPTGSPPVFGSDQLSVCPGTFWCARETELCRCSGEVIYAALLFNGQVYTPATVDNDYRVSTPSGTDFDAGRRLLDMGRRRRVVYSGWALVEVEQQKTCAYEYGLPSATNDEIYPARTNALAQEWGKQPMRDCWVRTAGASGDAFGTICSVALARPDSFKDASTNSPLSNKKTGLVTRSY